MAWVSESNLDYVEVQIVRGTLWENILLQLRLEGGVSVVVSNKKGFQV